MSSNSFSLDLSAKCREANIGTTYATRIENEIREHVHFDTLTSYYISTGPMPSFSQTILDVLLLTEDFIYNYEVITDYCANVITVPLTSISYLKEARSPIDEGFWSLLLATSLTGQHGLMIEDKIDNRDKIRKFHNDCRNQLAAIIKAHM